MEESLTKDRRKRKERGGREKVFTKNRGKGKREIRKERVRENVGEVQKAQRKLGTLGRKQVPCRQKAGSKSSAAEHLTSLPATGGCEFVFCWDE